MEFPNTQVDVQISSKIVRRAQKFLIFEPGGLFGVVKLLDPLHSLFFLFFFFWNGNGNLERDIYSGPKLSRLPDASFGDANYQAIKDRQLKNARYIFNFVSGVLL